MMALILLHRVLVTTTDGAALRGRSVVGFLIVGTDLTDPEPWALVLGGGLPVGGNLVNGVALCNLWTLMLRILTLATVSRAGGSDDHRCNLLIHASRSAARVALGVSCA